MKESEQSDLLPYCGATLNCSSRLMTAKYNELKDFLMDHLKSGKPIVISAIVVGELNFEINEHPRPTGSVRLNFMLQQEEITDHESDDPPPMGADW